MATNLLDPVCETVQAPGNIALTLCYLLKAPASKAGCLRYLADRKLYEKLGPTIDWQAARAEYDRHLPLLARTLAELIPAGLDAIACVPSSALEDIIAPYRDSIAKRLPHLTDLTNSLAQQPGSGSDSGRSATERLDAMTFTPPSDRSASFHKVLLVDDVFQSGVSLASAALAIQKHTPHQLEFVAACALWVVPEIPKGPSMAEILSKISKDSGAEP
jgi:hypothetical protein